MQEKTRAFDEWCKKKGWDLLGIQDEGVDLETWRQTKVEVNMISKVTTIGNTGSPFKVKKEE
ncbi:hypothetical protein D3C73_1540280 [compost metagenome]